MLDTGPCASTRSVVTDIDETLTTLDAEWFKQISNPSHDPAMRPDADTLMNAYADLGYDVIYVTARGEDSTLSDGTPARDATADWLVAHGFPYEEGALFLAPGIGAVGDSAVEYKTGVLLDLQADGRVFDYAYGNATSDIEAFQAAGIPDDVIFLVGELAGEMGVKPIPDEEAYTAHIEAWMPGVPEALCE